MKNLPGLGKDLDLLRRRGLARMGKVGGPTAVLEDLHGFEVHPGERVIDTVTGLEVEVVGVGVRNVEASE